MSRYLVEHDSGYISDRVYEADSPEEALRDHILKRGDRSDRDPQTWIVHEVATSAHLGTRIEQDRCVHGFTLIHKDTLIVSPAHKRETA